MRLLVEVSGEIEDWHRAFDTSHDRPRLPLPFSSAAAFVARGHDVSAINFAGWPTTAGDAGRFRKLYGPADLKMALRQNDVMMLWAAAGVRAVASSIASIPPQRKVLLASYVWRTPKGGVWKATRLAITTRLAARFARAVVLMTDEQVKDADRSLRGRVPVLRFAWGVDSAFYRSAASASEVPASIRQELDDLLREPYFILAGDQQRLDHDALDLVEKHGFRLVRVPQERRTAEWYRQQIRDRKLEGRLFVFERVPYSALRFLFQQAVAYVGLVDSTWQPAGWTVLCEALASGTPGIIYEGLVAREIRRLGARDYVAVVPYQDIHAFAGACEQIRRAGKNAFRTNAMNFAEQVLDLERTAESFVKDVERCVSV